VVGLFKTGSSGSCGRIVVLENDVATSITAIHQPMTVNIEASQARLGITERVLVFLGVQRPNSAARWRLIAGSSG
jgi:hypothetical protein